MQGQVGVQFVFIDLRSKLLKAQWLYHELIGDQRRNTGYEVCTAGF